ncbi:MAG: hypothetical protein Q8P31_10300 [Bacillota bacterium]|nr:hypothetical protein [Bacillota bacterium]
MAPVRSTPKRACTNHRYPLPWGRRRPVSSYSAALMVLLMLAGSAMGCGNLLVSAGNGTGAGDSPPQVPPLDVIWPDAVSPVQLTPLWSQQFDRPVTAALAGDGRWVVVGRSYGSSSSEYWGALLFDAAGKQVWSRSFRENRYRTIRVSSLGGGSYFSIALFTYSNPGVAYLYSAEGQRVWSRSVRSSVALGLDEGSSSLYGVDHGSRELFVAAIPSGQARTLRSVGADASLDVAGSRALVYDKTSALLLGSDGSLVHQQTVPQGFLSMVLAADGSGVFAATGGADSAVLHLDDRGQLVWSTHIIPPAGSNSLEVSPSGQHVMAYNITLDSGFAVLEASDGRILCRNSFAPVEEKASQFIRWAKFLPEQDAILVDYAVARSLATGHVEEHSLLLFSVTGELRARFDAGSNVDVLVSDDGQACVTVSNVSLDWSGPRVNTLRYYDLTPLFGRR